MPKQELKPLKSLKDLKAANDQRFMKKKESKGSIYKKNTGISKSTKRSIQKAGLSVLISDLPEGLAKIKTLRKARKKAIKKIQQANHATSVAYKRAHGKAKGKKGKQSTTKEKK